MRPPDTPEPRFRQSEAPAISRLPIKNRLGTTLSRPITAGRHVIEVINAGTQPHELTITHYPSGQGNRDLEAWAYHPQGGPAPGHGMGGATDIAPGGRVVIQVDFKPGKYGFICFTPDMKGGKPHFMHGMQKEFVVR